MRKFIVCIGKEKDGSLYAFNPKYGHIVVNGNSEQEVIDKLKIKILEYLKSDYRRKDWLEEFNEINKNLRLKHIKK